VAKAINASDIDRDMVLKGLHSEAVDKVGNKGSERIAAWAWLGRIMGLVVDRSRVEALVQHEHSLTGLSKDDLLILVEEGRIAKAERLGLMVDSGATTVE
jgi:hypothetical protein